MRKFAQFNAYAGTMSPSTTIFSDSIMPSFFFTLCNHFELVVDAPLWWNKTIILFCFVVLVMVWTGHFNNWRHNATGTFDPSKSRCEERLALLFTHVNNLMYVFTFFQNSVTSHKAAPYKTCSLRATVLMLSPMWPRCLFVSKRSK